MNRILVILSAKFSLPFFCTSVMVNNVYLFINNKILFILGSDNIRALDPQAK